MNTNQQIITDLRQQIGFEQTLDFVSDWKGVPVMIRGQMLEIRDESILFRVAPPDSVCLAKKEDVLILHDVFIMGIRSQILNFAPQDGIVELGAFTYTDRGFGDREMVRVEPAEAFEAKLILAEEAIFCQVVDLSLSGFGLLAPSVKGMALNPGAVVQLDLKLLDDEIQIPGTLLGVYPKESATRIAISFSQDAPGHTQVRNYITRRRAEIRQEIETAYQQAIGKNA